MFHKVKSVCALPDHQLSVQFAEGLTKIYDVKPLFKKWVAFKALEISRKEKIWITKKRLPTS